MEHTADPAFARAHLDERQDELVPGVARLGLHRGDVDRWNRSASDASDGAHQDAVVDAAHLRLVLLPEGAGAGKSAAQAQDDRVLDAFQMALAPVPLVQEQPDAAAPCKPDAVPSAGQSCVGPAFAEQAEVRDEMCSEPMGSQSGLLLKSLARLVQAEPQPLRAEEEAQPRDASVPLLQQAEAGVRLPVVSQPRA